MSQERFNRPSSAPAGLPPSSISSSSKFLGQSLDFWAIRVALLGIACLVCYNLGPFGVHGLPAAGIGFLMAMVILLAELRLRRAEISGLMGGAVGVVLGLLA